MPNIFNEQRLIEGSAAAGTPVNVVLPAPGPVHVAVNPGGTVIVKYTLSSLENIDGDSAVWHTSTVNGASAAAVVFISGFVSAVRIEASTSASPYEVRYG